MTSWSMILQSCMFRKSALDKIEPFREDWLIAEDQDFFLRSLLSNNRLIFTPGNITVYRLHEGSKLTTSGTSNHRKAIDWANFLIESEELLKSSTPEQGNPCEWLGFRIRLWHSLRSLERIDTSESKTRRDTIESLLEGYSTFPMKILGSHLRIRKGIQFRINGSRYNRSFQTGPINQAQEKWINEIGYNLGSK